MSKLLKATLLCALPLACGCQPQPQAPSDLQWIPPKMFTPPAGTVIQVDGFGVDDSVFILPPGMAPTAVSKRVTNADTGAVSASYDVRELIEVYAFRSPPPGWVPVDTVFDQLFPGPTPIAAGDTAIFSAAVNFVGACGLYRETLTLDENGAIAESNEGNNVETDFFFIPSNQQFNIAVDTVDDQLFHGQAAPIRTHDFVVRASSVPALDSVFFGFSFVATEGSTASTDLTPGKYALPLTVQMLVTPQVHNIPGGFEPSVTGKITVISKDGCVLKQQTAKALVEHG